MEKATENPFNGDIYLAEEVLKLKEKYALKAVIETGTYLAQTTTWLAKHFDKVYTIEINENYFNQAAESIKSYPNVINVLGDSTVCLPGILQQVETPFLAWIDSHWGVNPLLRELTAIKNSGHKPVIMIHDFKNPHHPHYGYDVYPAQNIIYEWSWIEPYINDIYGAGQYTYYYNQQATGAKRGCVFIVPVASVV